MRTDLLATFNQSMGALIILAVIVIIVLAIVGHKKKPSVATFPDTYRDILNRDVAFYRSLDNAGKAKFEQGIIAFLNRTRIEWIGTTQNDDDTVLIAASAVIPIFAFDGWHYPNLSTVLLYPDTFNHEFNYDGDERNIMGMVGTGYMNGQMILSQSALRSGFKHPEGKSNTGIHEFVHLLDKVDGIVDGVPESLLAQPYVIPWVSMAHKEMEKIKAGHSDINPYGATNQSEFLAVVSEYFFTQPDKLQHKHPELFALLEEVFHQQPQQPQ